MFKRTLLVIGMMAALFSVQADLMLYTFEGMYTNEITCLTGDQIVSINFKYDILVDFDMPGLWDGSPIEDAYIEFPITYASHNRGSASLSPEDPYYNNDATEYNTAYANEYVAAYNSDNYIFDKTNSIEFLGINEFGVCNQLYFSNKTEFEEGYQFSVEERYEDYTNDVSYVLTGNAQLISIEPVNSQNVPEPSSMALVLSGIITVSGLGLRRKKCSIL